MHCPHCHREYDAPETTCVHDGAPLVAARRLSLVRAEPWPEAGTMFGERYRAIGLLGKGAVAEVLLAEDIQTGEPVAVKVLHGKLQRDRDMRTRFLREATASERIGHPNIVHILDSGERRDGTVYLVLEFLFGESFGDLLRREGKIDAELALPILHQVAEALAAAHEAGIVHRDVKPDNVYLVGAKGEPYGVKLLDFGFAKLVESGLTAVGTTLGTPPYMAPEQILTDPVGPAVDIYALGVVLYRALTGVLPFAQKNDLELLAHHLFVTPTPPRSHAPELDPGIEKVILRALRKRPENRYPSMRGFVEELERLLGDRPGALFATLPLVTPVDEYEPKGPLGRTALPHFARLRPQA
jgi:serine/threonine protein kinase